MKVDHSSKNLIRDGRRPCGFVNFVHLYSQIASSAWRTYSNIWYGNVPWHGSVAGFTFCGCQLEVSLKYHITRPLNSHMSAWLELKTRGVMGNHMSTWRENFGRNLISLLSILNALGWEGTHVLTQVKFNSVLLNSAKLSWSTLYKPCFGSKVYKMVKRSPCFQETQSSWRNKKPK